MKPDIKAVGKRIKKIRKEKKYTMEQFGKLVGDTAKGTVNNWEKGNNLPNKQRLEKIALLGNTTEYWIKWGDFSDYVSQVTKDYEGAVLKKFGKETYRNFKEGLLDELDVENITYEQDMEIISVANRILERLISVKETPVYLPIGFEGINNEFVISIFEELTRKDFELSIKELIKRKTRALEGIEHQYDEMLLKEIASILYYNYTYSESISEISELRKVYVDSSEEN